MIPNISLWGYWVAVAWNREGIDRVKISPHCIIPVNKFHKANMGLTWVLSAPGRPHVGPMNLAIWHVFYSWPPFMMSLQQQYSILNLTTDMTMKTQTFVAILFRKILNLVAWHIIQ